jgi:hypothetical protein
VTPPPIDPIRPLSDHGDGIYVERADHAEGVHRRAGHDEDAGQRGARHQQQQHHDEEPTGHVVWVDSNDEDVAEAAGLYDDHGRGGVHEVAPIPRLHLDTTA